MRLVTLDQALSSASSLLVVIVAAHQLSAADFGRFGLILLVQAFALGPTRALISLPVLVHPDDADLRPWLVLGSAWVLGLWAGTLCCLCGALLLMLESGMATATLLLGLLLPLLLIQDVARFLAIARFSPGGALGLDAVWMLLMVAGFVGAASLGLVGLESLVLIWGGSGAAAGLGIFIQYGRPGRGTVSLTWLRERWDFSWRSLIGNLSNTGGALAGASVIAVVSSPLAVAAVRAAMLLGRPSAMVQAAVSASIAADVAREQPDGTGLRRQRRRAMSVSTLVGAANLIALVLLPDWAGEKVLGNVWPVIDPLRLPVGLAVVATAAQAGIRAVLLGRRQIRITMWADIVGGLLAILSLILGAVVADAEGAVWGLFVGQTLTGLSWWSALTWYLRSGNDHSCAKCER